MQSLILLKAHPQCKVLQNVEHAAVVLHNGWGAGFQANILALDRTVTTISYYQTGDAAARLYGMRAYIKSFL